MNVVGSLADRARRRPHRRRVAGCGGCASGRPPASDAGERRGSRRRPRDVRRRPRRSDPVRGHRGRRRHRRPARPGDRSDRVRWTRRPTPRPRPRTAVRIDLWASRPTDAARPPATWSRPRRAAEPAAALDATADDRACRMARSRSTTGRGYDVGRGDDGRLELPSARSAETAVLVADRARPDGVELALTGVRETDEVLLRNAEDPVRALPASPSSDGVGRATRDRGRPARPGPPPSPRSSSAPTATPAGSGAATTTCASPNRRGACCRSCYGAAAGADGAARGGRTAALLGIRLMRLEPATDDVGRGRRGVRSPSSSSTSTAWAARPAPSITQANALAPAATTYDRQRAPQRRRAALRHRRRRRGSTTSSTCCPSRPPRTPSATSLDEPDEDAARLHARESLLVPARWDGQFSALTDVGARGRFLPIDADVLVTVTPALLATAVQLRRRDAVARPPGAPLVLRPRPAGAASSPSRRAPTSSRS